MTDEEEMNDCPTVKELRDVLINLSKEYDNRRVSLEFGSFFRPHLKKREYDIVLVKNCCYLLLGAQ